ncbi:MAG: ribonuclease H [Gammaproteobacteria bacterium]|nr:ribonuclease H [Gammaproteobacteria bacterium]NKB63589.1 ribonuclease H [Gammaproteobacteria bacterium]NKB64519.1 ribonuclease H [Gammaproteobacteria bacterium]
MGYGAYLLVTRNELEHCDIDFHALRQRVKTKRFDHTSSTRLELQTLLWALTELSPIAGKIIVHTDSQNIITLPDRRRLLERRGFCSKKNQPLKNQDLYRRFYFITDRIDMELVKVAGHKPVSMRADQDRLFALVDGASRRAARAWNL